MKSAVQEQKVKNVNYSLGYRPIKYFLVAPRQLSTKGRRKKTISCGRVCERGGGQNPCPQL